MAFITCPDCRHGSTISSKARLDQIFADKNYDVHGYYYIRCKHCADIERKQQRERQDKVDRRRERGPTWSICFFPGFTKLGTTYGTADEAKAAAVAELRSWLTGMLGGLP